LAWFSRWQLVGERFAGAGQRTVTAAEQLYNPATAVTVRAAFQARGILQ
jgi:hypothetical protein